MKRMKSDDTKSSLGMEAMGLNVTINSLGSYRHVERNYENSPVRNRKEKGEKGKMVQWSERSNGRSMTLEMKIH